MENERLNVNMIVAMGDEGAIGRKGDLIWKISEDLKRFKTLTTGHPVIMGRKTWESLGKKPLPNRRNIILTHKKDYEADGAEIVTTKEDALKCCNGLDPFIIGGAQIYLEFLPYISTIYLTRIYDKCEDADTFLDPDFTDSREITEESETKITPEGLRYKYITYKK